MTVNYTSLLALGQPVTGTEPGTWGDDVNNAVTSYLDVAIAGTQTLSTDADVTLTLTQGTSSATNLSSTSAQYMILNCTGSRTQLRYINTPNSSKAYIVMNNTTGGYNVTIRGGTGPTTGISVAPGKQTWVAWDTNAGDFKEIASGDVDGPASSTDNAIARFDGTTGKVIQNSAATIADTTGDITAGAYNKVTITAPASSATLTIADGKTLTANRSLTFTGTDGTTQTFPSTSATIARTDAGQTFTGTQTFSSAPVVSTLTASKPVFSDGSSALTSSGTLASDQGGTGQTSYTAGDLIYYATGTAFSKLAIGGGSTVLTSSGTAPQWTSLSGISVGTATNLAGGAAGSVPYQTGSGVTSFLAIGTANYILGVNSGATAPEWVANTGTGSVVRATSPTLTTPVLGVATVTTVNKVSFTAPASGATLTLADGSTLATSGANSLTFTTTGTTNLTLPTSGTVATTGNTVTSLSFGTTGFTPSTATNGAITVAGNLSPANGGTGVANNALNTITFTGNYSLGLTLNSNTSVTLPTTGTLATLAGSETLTNKTINGSNNTITNVSLSTGITGTLGVGNGGTGNTSTPTNGQLLIGNGSGFSLAALTAGSNITITNSSGGITIASTGGGTPGGSDTQVQFNDSGSFGGDAGLTYNKTTNTLSTDVYVASAGTASAPSITTTGDTNTGVFFPAADTVGVATGGSERMRIDSLGNVGIGVTPSVWYTTGGYHALQVGNTSLFGRDGTNSELYLNANAYDNSSGNATYISTDYASRYNQNDGAHAWFTAPSGTAGSAITFTERMRITSAGFVGIGTSSPAVPLDVVAQTSASIARFRGRSSDNIATLEWYDNTNATRYTYISSGPSLSSFWNQANTPMAFGTNDTERMRIDSSGNVGIGSTSPSTYGDSGGGPNIVVQSTGTGRGVLVFASQQTGGADEFLGKINFIDSDSTNTNFRGAGILGVRGSDANSAYLTFNTANSGNGAERMRLNVDGYLLVGYTASNGAYKLQVNSQIFATSATIATSDGRYKENVTPLTGALDIVKALNPVQFQWKQHPVHNFDRSCPTVGFIAQEVQQVLADKPYLDSIIKANECTIQEEVKDEEGNVVTPAVKEDFYGIAEGNMIAILTKALQEAIGEIETLKTKVAALEAK